MAENTSPGASLCGAVRFEIAAVPEERLRITAGEGEVTHYRSSEIGTRSFCHRCGSPMFCTLDTHPGVIDVALACLAPGHGAVPLAQMFWDDRAGWVEVGDRLPRLGGKSGHEPR